MACAAPVRACLAQRTHRRSASISSVLLVILSSRHIHPDSAPQRVLRSACKAPRLAWRGDRPASKVISPMEL
jgi:hypothetical protein